MSERYVDARELAELMGVSVRTIERMTTEGMPSRTWGMRVRRYLPTEAMAWAETRRTDRITVRKRPAGAATPLRALTHQEDYQGG